MKRPIPIFTGYVKAGKLKIVGVDKIAMSRYIMSLSDGAYDIIIRKYRNQRTSDQNAYYWSTVVSILSDHFGYEPEDMHTELKRLFNPVKSKIDGAIIGGTTTKMNTVEFFGEDEQSYINRICRWAAIEHQVYIPPPKKVDTK